MSDLYDDPELERQLDAAFRASRPRRGFEDELWTRLQRRRPLPERVMAWIGGLPLAPALATVSVLLVLGGFVFLLGHRSGGGAATSSGGAATAKNSQGLSQAGTPADAAQATKRLGPRAFGAIPAVPTTLTTSYAGGLDLSLVAALPALPADLPVYRYQEPTAADAAAFARSRGAGQPQTGPAASQGGASVLGMYASPTGQITVVGSDAPNLAGPTYIIDATTAGSSPRPAGATPAGITDSQAETNANAYLAQSQLQNTGKATVRNNGDSGAQVVYPSRFGVPGLGLVDLVDAQARPVSTQVSLGGDGRVFQASGPFPLTTQESPYASASSAKLRLSVQAASAPAGAAARPRVELGSARLVYVAVPSAAGGYLEPAVALTGSVQSGGSVYPVTLLVSALDGG